MGYSTKRSKKVENRKLAIFVENMDFETSTQFGYELVLGFKQNAFRHKWNVTVIPVTSAFQLEEKYDTYMLKNGFCGAFLIGFALHDEWMRQLETTTMPTVLLTIISARTRMSPISERTITRGLMQLLTICTRWDTNGLPFKRFPSFHGYPNSVRRLSIAA